MLSYDFNGVSEASRMRPDNQVATPVVMDQEQKTAPATATNLNAHLSGAVTVARSVNICHHAMMTASNPAANAAAAGIPSYVVVRFGGSAK